MPPRDILFVEDSAWSIGHRSGMLEFIGYPDIHIPVYPFQELRIQEELLLGEPFLIRIGRVVTEAPEIVGVIAVRSLETGDMIFSRKEDSRAEDEDQLRSKGIKPEQVDVRGPGTYPVGVFTLI